MGNYTLVAFQNVLYRVFDKLYLVVLFFSYRVMSEAISFFLFCR